MITVVAVTQIALRLISVAGVIWAERSRAASHRAQMETAAAGGTMLCERLANGAALLIIPPAAWREPSAAETIHGAFREMPSL
jgi:hypothetical protein